MRKTKWMVPMTLISSMLFTTTASALEYSGNIGNQASFQTMAEVQATASDEMNAITGVKYMAHPAMAEFPSDTTYVYRSADMYGRNAAVRINTNLVVYSDKSFASKEDAQAYLKELGLIDMIDQAKGSIVLVTPSDPEKGFTAADQKYYYDLQTAMFSINVSEMHGEEKFTYVDAYAYGGYGYLYVIGIDGGATFLNNYVSGTFDYVSRIAGMVLVGGSMDRVRDVASFVPVYLVNPTDSVEAKYEAVNGTDSILREGDKVTHYNQQYPVRRVVSIRNDDVDLPAIMNDAYYNFLIKAKRGQEITGGLYSASTPYQGYGADCAPYSLSPRDAIIDGKTEAGIYLFEHVEERFADVKTEAGEYLQTWYEYLPEDIVNGTAQPGTVPLILALHGGGDDPRQFVDGQGFLELAGREKLAIVAPEKGALHTTDTEGDDFMSKVMPRLVRYMLDTYPALDASRVYVTGFSMGSLATLRTAYGAPELFAAAYPQSGIRGAEPTEEDAKHFENVDLPMVVSTSEYNMVYAPHLSEGFYNLISKLAVLDKMDALPAAEYDTYPISGFKADIYTEKKLNDDYVVHSWYLKNDDGIPMIGATYVESIVHCLYPQHANMIWDFFKHYSRDLETGKIIYHENVD